MRTLKLLTWQAVCETAGRQFRRNGRTTTLDVKRALRRAGYWATQDDVSYLMANLAALEGWLWEDNGVHRTYAPAPAFSFGMVSTWN